jgi:hypothetical protein
MKLFIIEGFEYHLVVMAETKDKAFRRVIEELRDVDGVSVNQDEWDIVEARDIVSAGARAPQLKLEVW